MTTSDEDLARAVHLLEETVVHADGPVAIDDLVRTAADQGIGPAAADTAVQAVLDLESVYATADGRAVSAWTALAGARVAHRLDAEELRHGLLALGADLGVLTHLLDPDDGGLFLGEDGAHLQAVDPNLDRDLLDLYEIPHDAVPPTGALLLVDVDLSAAAAGDVIVVAIDDGEATLLGPAPAGDASVPDRFDDVTARGVGEALLDAWRELAQIDLEVRDPDLRPGPDQMPVALDELVFEALLRDRRLLGPGSPPLGEVLAQTGWATDGLFVGAEGTDFGLAERTLEIAELAMFYRLGEEQAVALGHLLALFDEVRDALPPVPSPDPIGQLAGGDEDLDRYRRRPPGDLPTADPAIDLGDDASVVLSWLSDPDVTAAFVSQAIGIRADHAPALFHFAVAARSRAPKAALPATAWLEAKALDRLGHGLAAAAIIDEAVRLDRDRELAPLLLDAANLASDRGELETALRFARDAGLDERDDFVRMLGELVPAPPADLGRNDPCFCGSGRKFKQCHLGRTDLDPDARAGWLYRKALEWVQDRAWRLRLIEIADAYAPDDSGDDVVLQLAMREPFVADLAFSDDGAWADFLADRGPLLPDVERELAETWGSIRRSVYEVVAVAPGERVELRDRRAGPASPTTSVADVELSTTVDVGDLLVARVLPTGHSNQVFGGAVDIAAVGAEALADALDAGASGLEIARMISATRRGPTLTNTEGELLVFCGATYRVPDGDAVRVALDADADLRADVDRPTDGDDEGIEPFDAAWVEEVTIDGRDWIRARYTLRADELVLEANSEARIERARARVEAALPGAELIHEEQRPLDHLATSAPLDPRALLGGGPSVTPELQSVLDQLTGDAEGGT